MKLIKTNMKAIMYKKGMIDCMRGVPAHTRNNKAYLYGYGRQYEREQVKTAVCHG